MKLLRDAGPRVPQPPMHSLADAILDDWSHSDTTTVEPAPPLIEAARPTQRPLALDIPPG